MHSKKYQRQLSALALHLCDRDRYKARLLELGQLDTTPDTIKEIDFYTGKHAKVVTTIENLKRRMK